VRLAIDATLLAYAANRYPPEHARAAQVLEDLVNGDLPWALPWSAVEGFLGSVTHPHAVVHPLGLAEATGFVRQVLTSPSVHPLGPTERHAETLAEIVAMLGEGPPPPGLELAAVLREHGVRELLSTDRRMRRFRFLEVTNPLRGPQWKPDAQPGRRYRILRGRG